ncbi:Ctr copper transporter family-domain-containing protein [Pavlovales sp. CCMP2436]|nr:Ctr copper transporter family-domain-containing protein [Pavlovales sp. CCMP2436]
MDMEMELPMTMSHGTVFSSNYKKVALLFAGWETMNGWQYALTLIAIICFGILSESMVLLERGLMALVAPPSEGLKTETSFPTVTLGFRMARSVLYATRTALHFLLMLASMTFDIGIFVCIMAGFGVGYFVFSSKDLKASGIAGHSHA